MRPGRSNQSYGMTCEALPLFKIETGVQKGGSHILSVAASSLTAREMPSPVTSV
ncbi:hypothetical protein ACVWWG_009487 [Bradyrhizobium sp. LB7.2]